MKNTILILCLWFFKYTHGRPGSFDILNDYQQLMDFSSQAIRDQYKNEGNQTIHYGDYDFIIVGSGPAGSVVANRLSEIRHWKILLIEAGVPENFLNEVPALCCIWQLTSYNWGYRMARTKDACHGMTNKQCKWPRGRALGGSSVINYMIYTRGSKYDFDQWSANGLPDWSWNNVLPYYIRSERAHLTKIEDAGYHGHHGELSVQNVPWTTPLLDAFLQSGIETGRPILDYNGHSQWGFSPVQAMVRNGHRFSAAKAFLRPVKKRPNLTILTSALVTEILIDSQTKTAFGVKFIYKHNQFTAFSKKEVILSAGTFSSAQLLMVSGVGPKDHLKEFNIDVIKDLPVGELIEDHLAFLGAVFTLTDDVGITVKDINIPSILDYFLRNNGSFTSLNGVEALGYIKTNISSDPQEDYADVELLSVCTSITLDGGTILREGFNIDKNLYDHVYKPINFKPSFCIVPMLLRPKSKGRLRLASNSILDFPILHGNYYSDPERHDIRTMIEAVKIILQLSKTSGFQKLGAKLHDIPYPNCKHLKFGSDPYWECALRTISPSLHHQVGTCKMGPLDDPTSVVGSDLKVHGIKRLRVIDTSVIPFAMNAHMTGPSFMIGEKGADYIKTEWR